MQPRDGNTAFCKKTFGSVVHGSMLFYIVQTLFTYGNVGKTRKLAWNLPFKPAPGGSLNFKRYLSIDIRKDAACSKKGTPRSITVGYLNRLFWFFYCFVKFSVTR